MSQEHVSEKKAYLTTDRAGYFVAGERIPRARDGDGNRIPKVGHRLLLTDAQARYELLQGVIEPEAATPEPAPLAPGKPVKTASTAVEG